MPKKKTFDIEKTLDELDTILIKMNDDETTLDENIELYAQAAKLIQQSHQKLQQAEIKVQEITKEIDFVEDEQ